MNCPKCGSAEVRPSSRARWRDRLLAFGRQRFRCRACRRKFYSREKIVSTADDSGKPAVSKAARRHRHKALSKSNKRRLLDALTFAVMLALFFVFLRYLTREPIPENPVSVTAFRSDKLAG